MGKRSRQRSERGGPTARLSAPATVYPGPEGSELELRGSLTPHARERYAAVLHGGPDREDAWQRASELLFELLTVSWTIADLRISRQQELLGRYRMASQEERRFVRGALRAHLAEQFPELEAP